ncbi:MAG: RnfABCDGE type electron transport complex subunit D [Thermoplasmata archaeon]|nr:RnfABCDGE type electron transport complex subunit D [Thermoplasmata archaeon]
MAPPEVEQGHSREKYRLAWPRFLPPARLLWMALAAIGIYGVHVLAGLGTWSLVALPVLAVLSDLAFQSVRFPRIRFPDAALATGLFLALIFPPLVPLVLAGAATFGAIAIRHALRFHGHPFLNPAVSGVVLGGVVFGLAPAWWVSVGPDGEYLMVGLAIVLLVRSAGSWRVPLGFFVAYGLVVAAVHLLVSTTVDSNVLLLAVVDPATLFFGVYMVSEPRTAPSDPALKPVYGAAVGVGAAVFPLVLPSLGILVALLLVNFVAGVLRLVATSRIEQPTRRPARSRAAPTRSDRAARWPVAYRASAVFFVMVVLIAAAAVAPNAHPQPIGVSAPGSGGTGPGPGGGGGPPLTNCSKDGTSIPASTLSSLHQMLGPSVILSDDPNTGVVIFYDPVNHVTVTESDLYEDFGYAEFNGDDYAVNGCHP